MELSPYISLSPFPHRFAFSFSFASYKRKYNKYTLAYTYCADELVYTVLCHTVHMREMLSKVCVLEFNLAQRALDSLEESRKKKSVNKWLKSVEFEG